MLVIEVDRKEIEKAEDKIMELQHAVIQSRLVSFIYVQTDERI